MPEQVRTEWQRGHRRWFATLCAVIALVVSAGLAPAGAVDRWSGYAQLGNNQVKSVAVASSGAARVDLFVVGTDSAVWTKRSIDGVWSGYTQLGSNQVKGLAVTSSAPGRIDLFVVGTDNAVWTKRSINGVWSGYMQLGNNQVKGVAATTSGTGRMHLFVIGTDDAVWTKRSVNDAWGGYRQLGTNKVKAIAATDPAYPATSGSSIDLFVVGTDDAVWTKRSSNGGVSYSGYTLVASNRVKGIAVTGTAKGTALYELNLLVVGTDDAVWRNTFVGCARNCL
jgi:hypothetical protein